MNAITVSNLGKAYKAYPTRWSRLLEWLDPRNKSHHQLHWVLQDINFSVSAGQALGIVGINGAGKSTLLKIITGTTTPTTGRVVTNGRIAALLELGMGFHPDFTGRQNVFMAGQLQGFTVEEISELMPQIEAFAEIGEYMDQPVRVYSSGMQMRLAFSVATARRPDVLIVDEALSVGDAYFQHKSFDRIREFRDQGTSLLIVSHDKQAILTVCDQVILLNAGMLLMAGKPEAVMDYYNAMLADFQNQIVRQEKRKDGIVQTISGNGAVSLLEAGLFDAQEQPLEVVSVGQDISLRILAQCQEEISKLVIGYMIKDRFGREVFGTNTFHCDCVLSDLKSQAQILANFDFKANFGPGNYSIAIALHAGDTHISDNYEWRDFAVVFNVVNINMPPFIGVAWTPPVVRIGL